MDNTKPQPHRPTEPLRQGVSFQDDVSSFSFPIREGRDGVKQNNYFYTTTPEQWAHLKPFARNNRKEQTLAEKTVWNMLRGKRFSTRFRRQHAISSFIVDFVSLEFQLVIEIDGEIHLESKEYDAWRTSVLNDLGYHVIRFTNDEVINKIDYVATVIKENLIARNPTQTLPHREGFQE